LVLVAFISIPMGWVAYQLDWIRQRHAFLKRPDWEARPVTAVKVPKRSSPRAPWSLRLFGELPQDILTVHETDAETAHSLFPEAIILPTERVTP